MNPIALSVLGVSAVLAAISIVVPLARRLMLPNTLVLAFLGVLIGLLGYLNVDVGGFGYDIVGGLREIGLLDDAFIYVYLPPLLFAAGLTVDIRYILEDVWHVMLLALVAVVLCTVFVGYAVAQVTGMALLSCLLLGTIVSTTDTAAVVNVFREVGAPKRLSTIVNGEALFNDAAAIAMFSIMLEMLTRGTSISALRAVSDFAVALIGGVAFGYLMARICCWLISMLKDTVTTEVTLTIAFAYFTFVVGSQILNVSGVVATVTLAIAVGAYGRTRVSPGSWESLHKVWEHLEFWGTSLIFVTSAMYVPRTLRVFDWQDVVTVAVVFVAALASRAVVIWGMMPTFSALGASRPLSHSYKIVLWWGGVRGAVTIALALATTATDGVPQPVQHMIASAGVGYVIASLVLNGLTLRPLMNMLRLDRLSEHERTLRNRVLRLARRRIRRELGDVAEIVGQDPDELSRSIVPTGDSRLPRMSAEEMLRLALATWCHHEADAVLSFRERGVLTRHHADMLRAQADRLQNALKTNHVDGYRQEVLRLRKPPATLRLAFWLYRSVGWKAPVISAIADHMEYLFGELLLLRELIQQAERDAPEVFGKELAAELVLALQDRADIVDKEIRAIERAYANLAATIRNRHLALVALGVVEAEYRRHLSEATITMDVFEDLDTRRRAIATRFAKRPEVEFDFNLKGAIRRFRLSSDLPALWAHAKPYFAFPGHQVALGGASSPLFFIVLGSVEVQSEDGPAVLRGGDMFARSGVIPGCRKVTAAVCTSHVKMLKVSGRRLASLLGANPALRQRLNTTPRRRRRSALQTH
jgi:CPA1 family monovalent cation:H+ antiporter